MRHFNRLLAVFLCTLALSFPVTTKAQAPAQTPRNADQPTQEAWERTVNEIFVRIALFYHRELPIAFLQDLRTSCIVVAVEYPNMPCLKKLDPHTYYVSPQNAAIMDERRSGEFVGVGIELKSDNKDVLPKGFLIVKPIPGSPAERAGVQAKDIIVEVDGRSTTTASFEDVVSSIRGTIGTKVRLTIWRKGAPELLSIEITRAKVVAQHVTHELKEGGVGYIKVTSFSEIAGTKTRQAILALIEKNRGPLKGLVLDLRDNSGGLLHVADEILDLFLVWSSYPDNDARVTVSEEIRGEISKHLSAGGQQDVIGGVPLLVLVNGNSASASELVPGVLQTHGRATVAGVEKTFGKGTVQTVMQLPTGGELALTTSQYLVGPTSCERPVQEIGITPDIFLKRGPDDEEPRRREESLPGSLDPSTISNANCRYPFTVPAEHKEAAKYMLRVLGLEIKE